MMYFISGVNLTTAALTINSDNLDINNSQITLGSLFNSNINVKDTINLKGLVLSIFYSKV